MLEQDASVIKDRLTEVSYEEFVRRPREELKRLYEFAGLSWYGELETSVPAELNLENNNKWQALPVEEKKILEDAFPVGNAVAD